MSGSFSASNIFLQSNSNGRRRCAACKYLRRRCSQDCILAPYFHHSQPERFVCVHRIFGASNVARMLEHVPTHNRAQAADTIATEAYMRMEDPVYGCTTIIARLQHEIHKAQNELAMLKAHITIHKACQQQQLQNISGQPSNQLMFPAEEAHWGMDDNGLLLPDFSPNLF
ncbi:LOB domain-containing protein 23 [Platanthera guangdongensis]|uniref:LOB domain-containing protein 23 n=1 Tax=Platanthera guangdongensis TaxID=2320717 RepID=A0ABR2MW87_9ASPA